MIGMPCALHPLARITLPRSSVSRIKKRNLYSHVLKVWRSKANQFGDKKVCILIPEISRDSMCPVFALKTLFHAHKAIVSLPAFSFSPFRWMCYSNFLKGMKSVETLSGEDPTRFGCHFLRHGRATFATNSGVLPYFIKLQGDWASNCYTRYIILSPES